MAELGSAVATACVTVAVAYATNFLAEEYRRHLDAKALAGALWGELKGHMSAVPTIRVGLDLLRQMARKGEKPKLRETADIASPIFESNTAKIGLLGAELAGEVAYAYERIRAFRVTMSILARDGRDMDPREIESYAMVALQILDDTDGRGKHVVDALHAFTSQKFKWAPIAFARQMLGRSQATS